MIETIPYKKVLADNELGISSDIEFVVSRNAKATAMAAMEQLLEDRRFDKYFEGIRKLIEISPWLNSGFGIYFATVANMKTTYGPRVISRVNQAFGANWKNSVELGSGVGTIVPYQGSTELLQLGVSKPDLVTQYDSPGGTYPSRWAAATILNVKIGFETAVDPVFTYADTYITPSSTYAIDTAYEAFARTTREEQSSKSEVVILGPSYYVLALAAADKGLKVARIASPTLKSGNVRTFFPSPKELRSKLPKESGMLVLTIPNNPNGEAYDNEDLRKIFELAKERGILILLDLLFDQLWFQEKSNYDTPNPLRVAHEAGVLDQTIVVDGLSKTLNLAGERIGILATTNKRLERAINTINISRLSNPSLTIEPVLQFEAIARMTEGIVNLDASSQSLGLAIELTKQSLQKSTRSQWLDDVASYKLTEWYEQRRDWMKNAMQYYEDNLLIILTLLDQCRRRISLSPDRAAYNTLVGFGRTNGNEGFDKILKLFLLTGIVAMDGQCFGVRGQKSDFWTRITYGGISRQKLPEAVARLVSFLDLWDEMDLGNPQKFPVIDTEFKVI